MKNGMNSILFLAMACTTPEPEDTGSTDTDEVSPSSNGWGDIIDALPQVFFASDLSENVQSGVTDALHYASEAWGNYGPLEYWVMGIDTQAGLDLIDQFCERRDGHGHWDKASCVEEQSATEGEHNFMSYLLVGQEAVETHQPMTSMGWNGNRQWGIHLYTSSYPFGFDNLFEYTTPEGETKTVFHEYFHAVQQANIYSKSYSVREELAGPVWFIEGGAEYMAMSTTGQLWSSGGMPYSDVDNVPRFAEEMRWKMVSGLRNVADNCPGKSLAQISYGDPCSYAAYELGAWGHAFLQHKSSSRALLDDFYVNLNDLGWEASFEQAFGRSSETFYAEFDVFLELPIEDQMAILPDLSM